MRPGKNPRPASELKTKNDANRANALKLFEFLVIFLCIISIMWTAALPAGQQTAHPKPSSKIKLPPEKKFVLDWLGQKEQVEFFGHISDRIWSFAELGLQEYKSSALLAEILEKEGFRVERGLAGLTANGRRVLSSS